MELGFVETLRRRWETLGIQNSTAVDIEIEDQNGDAARQEILDGEIVKAVLRDALKGKLPASPLQSTSEFAALCLSPSCGRYFQRAFTLATTLSHKAITKSRPLPL